MSDATSEPQLRDFAWYGPAEAVLAAVAGLPNVIGPLIVGTTAFVTVHSAEPLETPPGLLATDPSLSAALLGKWQGDPSTVPRLVSRRQARVAMRGFPMPAAEGEPARSLFDVVDDYCRQTGGDVLEAWNESPFFYRDSPFIVQLSGQFGISDPQLDALFIAAGQVA